MPKRKYVSLEKLEKDLSAAMPADITSTKSRKVYPCFYLDNTRVAIPDEKLGKEIEAEVKLYIVSKRIKDRENEKGFDYEFEVRAMRFPEGQKDERHLQQRLEDELKSAKEK
jgi:hypothetical protein